MLSCTRRHPLRFFITEGCWNIESAGFWLFNSSCVCGLWGYTLDFADLRSSLCVSEFLRGDYGFNWLIEVLVVCAPPSLKLVILLSALLWLAEFSIWSGVLVPVTGLDRAIIRGFSVARKLFSFVENPWASFELAVAVLPPLPAVSVCSILWAPRTAYIWVIFNPLRSLLDEFAFWLNFRSFKFRAFNWFFSFSDYNCAGPIPSDVFCWPFIPKLFWMCWEAFCNFVRLRFFWNMVIWLWSSISCWVSCCMSWSKYSLNS